MQTKPRPAALALLAVLITLTSLTPPARTLPPAKGEAINWVTFEEAIELNKKEPKKIFLDVYTDWCGWCKQMDKTTFSDSDVARYVNQNYYAVKFDAEGKDPITFKGRTFGFVASGRRGYHELAATLMNGRMSYPTTVYLDEEMNLLQAVPGYAKADEFLKIVSYFGGDHFKQTPWEEYEKAYAKGE
ncbi:MAG: DUF255 domain-containing protein [Catalinimonas sp.]